MRSRNATIRAVAASIAVLAAALAQAAPRPTAVPAVELRLAELHPIDHPTTQADYEFARIVGERSGGRIRISVYPDSALGQEVSVLEQLQFGAIDIARVSLSAVSVYVPRLRALQMPYLYKDAAQMWRVLKADVGRELLAGVSEAGFVGLGYYESGARSVYTAGKAIRSPSDLAGLDIRVQEGSVVADVVEALGARPVPMAFGEVYSAIQTGRVDGAENNASTYYTYGQYKIAPFYSLTEHARIPEIIVGSSVAFASLSEADRSLIAEAAIDSSDYQRAAWDVYERLAIQRVRAAGATVIEVSEPKRWRALAETVYARQPAEIKAVVARIRAIE
jgi:tripartite ATP-independent transporter DctP family solute receptor